MPVTITPLEIPEILLLQPSVFTDHRGHFLELWNEEREAAAGFGERFAQDNIAVSQYRVLRGLHFQHPEPHGKLISCVSGEIFDVAVDIRPDSTTFGKFVTRVLCGSRPESLFIPAGFAHGYQILSDEAVVFYKCTSVYRAGNDRAIAWNDPALNIPWPIGEPILSDKDARAGTLHEVMQTLSLSASS